MEAMSALPGSIPQFRLHIVLATASSSLLDVLEMERPSQSRSHLVTGNVVVLKQQIA
jgi:hypothetical protein